MKKIQPWPMKVAVKYFAFPQFCGLVKDIFGRIRANWWLFVEDMVKIRKSENAQMFLFLTDSKHQESLLFIFDFVLITYR